MKIDLHNHTTYSDGLFTPEELINIAIQQGVGCFAITDHDSVFGCDEIQEAAKKYDIHVISGMELSTYYKGEPVHIVCLFKNNIVPEKLLEFSINKKHERKNRAIKMMTLIRDIYGVKIDLDSLINDSEIITRANMVYNIVKCNGITQAEASKYVNNDSKAYIPSTKMSVDEGLKLAKEAGALTILAHPCLLPREYVLEIIDKGFDGIEVWYPFNKGDDAEFFTELALKYNLLKSAGSDFHGDENKKHAMIGTSVLNEELFEPIKERLCLKWK